MKPVKGKEIIISSENKIGKLQEIAKIIQDNSINVRAISGWHVEGKAFIRLVTSDNIKTKEALQSQGQIEEKDIVIVDMPDEVGKLNIMASKLKEANIDLEYIYGTTSQPQKSAIIIFSSSDNDKAIAALSA